MKRTKPRRATSLRELCTALKRKMQARRRGRIGHVNVWSSWYVPRGSVFGEYMVTLEAPDGHWYRTIVNTRAKNDSPDGHRRAVLRALDEAIQYVDPDGEPVADRIGRALFTVRSRITGSVRTRAIERTARDLRAIR